MAKRYYDHSLTTNPDGSLAVYISLARLFVKMGIKFVSENTVSSMYGKVREFLDMPVTGLSKGEEMKEHLEKHPELQEEDLEVEIDTDIVLLTILSVIGGYLLWRRNQAQAGPQAVGN
jgi:hypothetical protein